MLRAGLSLGGNSGPAAGSCAASSFDVGDRRRTVDGAAIAVWGTGGHAHPRHDGARPRPSPSGVAARRPDGPASSAASSSRGFTDFGVLVDANEPDRAEPRGRSRSATSTSPDVARPRPGSSDGRAEACVWIGDTGTVRRVRARSCAWSRPVDRHRHAARALRGIDVDGAPTGIYVEHFTRDSTFRRLRIGARVRIGLRRVGRPGGGAAARRASAT